MPVNGLSSLSFSISAVNPGRVNFFFSETGIETNNQDWEYLCEISGDDFSVAFYYSQHADWDTHLSTTDEEVFHIPVIDLHTVRHYILPNLNWLIHMAIDKVTGYSGKIKVD